MAEGQRQIFGLGLVRLSLSDLPEQPADSTVTVRYRVQEGRPRLITGRVGYESESGTALEATWSTVTSSAARARSPRPDPP